MFFFFLHIPQLFAASTLPPDPQKLGPQPQAIVDELMDRGMPSRTAHSLGWWLWRRRYAPVLQQRRPRWERDESELGEEGNESESEVEELESLAKNERIWLVCGG